MIEEIWKPIERLEGYYEISNKGRIRSLDRMVSGCYGSTQLKKGQIMKPIKMPNGYLAQGFYFNGKHRQYYIHRLVAKAFIPNPENLPEINHKDENKENNCIENLEWCSHLYNIRYGNARKKISVAKRECAIRPVTQKDLNGVILAHYRNASIASEITGIDSSAILKVCAKRGKFITAGSFIWEFAQKDSEALF